MLLSQHYKKDLVAVAVDEAHCDVGEMNFFENWETQEYRS